MSSNPTALITGASRGIGRAVAIALAKKGYAPILVARDADKLSAVAGTIRGLEKNDKGAPIAEPVVAPCDLTDISAVAAMAQRVLQRAGRIDVLFNNAGASIPGTLALDSAALDNLYALNLRAPFELMRAVVPVMRKQGSGYIFNLASRNGKVAVAGLGAYSGTKFGLVGLSESLYRELAGQGIKVTALCPGWVNTDMAAGEGCHLCHERMIQPEHIASTVIWLLELGPSVSVMELMLECTDDVERRATGELHALYGRQRAKGLPGK